MSENAPQSGDLAFRVLVLCAVVVTGLLVRREFFSPGSAQARSSLQVEPNWQSYVSSEMIYGAHDAPTTIVEFGDYECPACRILQVYLDSLLSLGKDFHVAYRHFPIQGHRFAIPAARASQCAADQGRFKQMHRLLYTAQDSLGLVPWWWYARMSGVKDSMAFEECLRSEAAGRNLAQDTLAGQRLRIAGTPVLLIGALRVNGAPSFDSLSAFIDRASGAMPP